MPVITPVIQGQLLGLFSNNNNQAPQVASQLISAASSGSASVQKIMGTAVIPYTPVGMAGAISMLVGAFSNTNNQPATIAQQIATAISLIDPTVPPVQLATI